jgi:hypothetical protein
MVMQVGEWKRLKARVETEGFVVFGELQKCSVEKEKRP